MDGVFRCHRPSIQTEWFSRIGIHIETGKITTRDVNANTVALFKHIGRSKRINSKLVNGPRLHQLLLPGRVAITRAENAVGQVHLKARWKVSARRIDVDELGREIGVQAIGRGMQGHCDGSDDFDGFLQWLGLIDHDIVTRL